MPKPFTSDQERLHAKILSDMLRAREPDAADHASLYNARRYARTQEEMDDLAIAEHRAFAREASEENPLLALPIMAAAPIYQGAKALGLTDARSNPSMAQLGGAWHGAWSGGLKGLRKRLRGE